MEVTAKELIRREKERRRLEREQKKKSQQIDNTLKFSLDHPPLKLNAETNDKSSFNEVAETIRACHQNENILNRRTLEEPSAPTNKKSCTRNLKGQFEKYTGSVHNTVQSEENLDNTSSVKRQKKCSTNVHWSEDLPYDFEEISKGEKSYVVKNENAKIKVTEDQIVETGDGIHEEKKSAGKKKRVADEEETKVAEEEAEEEAEEIYEIIEPDDISEPLMENEAFLKKIKKRQKENNTSEEMKYARKGESEKAEELSKRFFENMGNRKLNEEANKEERNKIKQNCRNIDLEITNHMGKEEEEYSQWLHNCLHDVEKYAPDELAYFKEIDYLLFMLKEKKKKLLGNLHDEEKEEKREKQKENVTEEDFFEMIDEFHMNVKAEKKKKKENQTEIQINFDEIYKLLEIEKRENALSGYLDEEGKFPQEDGVEDGVGDERKNVSKAKKDKTEAEQLPKGFFDDQEEKAYIKQKRDLAKINEKIKLLEMEKEKIMQEYDHVDEAYEGKINSYIDYLWEDKCYDKKDILYQVKQKQTNSNKLKGENRLWIEATFEEGKRKEAQRKVKKQQLQEYLSAFRTTVHF